MKKKIISAATVFACTALMVSGSIVAYESQVKEDSITAGVFAYTAVDNIGDDMSVADASVVATAAPVQRNSFGYNNLGVSVAEGKLNVREQPTTESEVVGIMPDNAVCDVVEADGDWLHIKSGDVEGYCLGSYIATGEEAQNIADSSISKKATVNCDSLTLRSIPSTEGDVVSSMNQGKKVQVLEELDGWVKVNSDGKEGYCSAEYVSVADEIPTAMSKEELASTAGASVVSNALQYVGGRYVWGGETLGKGVDCSGFTMKILEQYGVYLPHSADAQMDMGTKVNSLAEAQPGDLVFYGSGGYANHVGIYMGDGQLVHASSAKTGIKISDASYRTPIGIRRYV